MYSLFHSCSRFVLFALIGFTPPERATLRMIDPRTANKNKIHSKATSVPGSADNALPIVEARIIYTPHNATYHQPEILFLTCMPCMVHLYLDIRYTIH